MSVNNIKNSNNDNKKFLTLQSVRGIARTVMDESLRDPSTSAFKINLSLLPSATKLIISLINRDYRKEEGDSLKDVLSRIPPHGRWRHFRSLDHLKEMCSSNGAGKDEIAMVFIDLFVVAVLMDAGAGDDWTFKEENTNIVSTRSEGLAMATLSMFMKKKFTTSTTELEVNVDGLDALERDDLIDGFQVSSTNPLVGVDGRLSLLKGLGLALKGEGFRRPSDILKGIIKNNSLDVLEFWDLLIGLFNPIWPISLTNNGLGDVFELRGRMVPFHKLTQWLCYSLLEPISVILGVDIINESMLTGLPEYRNGGMFVDLGILELRDHANSESSYSPKHPTIIEWRALTIVLLDMVAEDVRKELGGGVSENELPLAKILEAGTWKAGRELAREKRPSGGPPIKIISDGTIF